MIPGVGDNRAATILAAFADAEQVAIAAKDLAVVVAHPDDETIGCGVLLARLRGARLILVSDGAPRNLVDARAHGFATRARYAQARLAELHQALAMAGQSADFLIPVGVADQEVAWQLVATTQALLRLF